MFETFQWAKKFPNECSMDVVSDKLKVEVTKMGHQVFFPSRLLEQSSDPPSETR